MKYIITESQYKLISEVRNKEEERNKIYQDDNLVVVAPLAHKASCKYGSHTKWCTAVPSNDEHFNEYMKHGVLIYFIVRSPHKNSKLREYKFAYYHSYDDIYKENQGWYDMSDYHISGDDREEKMDKNLVKFLIPDEVFNLVKEYIKNQKGEFILKQKQRYKEIVDYFLSDPDNTDNTIVNDNTWFISYRKKPFNDFYNNNDFGYVYLSPNSSMTVMYVNKKTSKIYYGNLNYYIDLRNYENPDRPRFNKDIEFTEVYNDKKSPEIKKIFVKYFPQILKAYFKTRKQYYNPSSNDYMYLNPKYVQIGDKLPDSRGGKHVSNISQDERGRYYIDVTDSSGRETKNTYYSDDIGMGILYDKERHNPL